MHRALLALIHYNEAVAILRIFDGLSIHLRYFRNRISDPVTELGWMIIGSMVVFHLSQKVISPSDVQQSKEKAGHPNDNSPFSGIDVSTIFNMFSKMA